MIDSVINRVVVGPPPPGHRITFARLGGADSLEPTELHASAGRLAAALRALGIGPGDRIGILAANCLEWVLLDLAALRLKAVTAGLEPGKFEPTPELITRYELTILFTDRPFAHSRVRPIGDVRRLLDEPVGSVVEPAHYTSQDITTIKFTSGSSGEPKGLAATVGSIDSSITAVQTMFDHGGDDNLFVFLPLSLLQQRYWVYSALCFGHDLTISTYQAAFPLVRTVRPTVVMGVPAFYEAAMRHLQADDRADAPQQLFGDRVRYLWTGSAPARPEMLRFFEDLGLPIYEGYGLNETCIVAKNGPGAHRTGSVGRVLAGKSVIFDEHGVVSVRCEHPVNDHYEYAPPGASERVFVGEGVVRTGDIGYLDEDGFLYIRGRADDTIVLDNGKKIIVRPIEERLRDSPAIAECVLYCIAQTHLVAVVSPTAGPPDEAAITAHLAAVNEGLAPDERIRDVVIASPAFSVANGMLSEQFKPRRNEILDAYRERIEEVTCLLPSTP